uniref:P-type domain-containing protein n=1 Tax=Xiphophorus couchianus TaxID=32473 RepID=A0A3B5M3Q7_9TELE
YFLTLLYILLLLHRLTPPIVLGILPANLLSKLLFTFSCLHICHHEYRLPCGSSSISETQCLSMGCCFNKHPPACYYPMDEPSCNVG